MNEWWFLGLLAGLTGLACVFIVYPFRRRFIASLWLVPLIFLGAFSGYFYWGSFGGWQDYVHYLNSQEHAKKMLESIKSPQELIDKLRAKLDDSPKSVKGWYLLGRLYSSQNENQKAVNAFAKAYQFNPDNEQYAVNYAHSLWILNNQQFTEKIPDIIRPDFHWESIPLQGIHYKAEVNDPLGNRFHIFNADGDKLGGEYQGLKGDYLKSRILLHFKDQLEEATSETINEVVEALEKSPEYKVLTASQGFVTWFFKRNTSSAKAFNAMLAERRSNLEFENAFEMN